MGFQYNDLQAAKDRNPFKKGQQVRCLVYGLEFPDYSAGKEAEAAFRGVPELRRQNSESRETKAAGVHRTE